MVAPLTESHDSSTDEDDAAVAVSPVGAESFVVVPELPFSSGSVAEQG